MKTNFQSTCGQNLNTIRKTTYARKATLQASTTRHKKKQERRQILRELRKRWCMLPKQLWPALILHNTHNIWREQNTREKALHPQWTVRDFHHKQEVQAEVSQPGEQLPEHQEGWRQQPRPCSETKERHKTKNQSIWPLGAWNVRPQSDDGNAFK